MALFFILFIPFTFICVMVIKSSMNYEFGSDRRKRTVRLSVVAATLAVVIAHSIMATGLMEFIWTGPTRDDPAATLVIHFAAATTGTLIWGFIVPKVVFSFVGTKPLGADKPDQTQQYIEQSTPLHEHERPIQPETARQQTQTHEAQLYPWEEETPKKSKKSILIGAGALALLSVGAIAVLTFMLTGGSPSRTTLANCDAWLQQQLVDSPQAAANAENANTVVAYVQTQRPDSCPPDAWNPLVTNVARDSAGNIDISFTTESRETRGTAVTMPTHGTARWVYLATDSQWYSPTEDSSPISAVRPTVTPLPSPTATVQPIYTRQPLQTVSAVRAPTPTPYVMVRPAYTPRPPSPILPSVQIPTPTSTTTDNNFASQRTKVAPTLGAAKTLAPTLVNQENKHLQWKLLTTTAPDQQKRDGFAGLKSVNDGKGQQYSCAIYLDGTQVPRVNLFFSKDLTYQTVTNQFGEYQGAINAITTVAGTAVPVEWRTWASRVDRIRLRDADAARLVHFINEWNVGEYVLELKDNPELSATYDVSNLIAAINTNEMTCFQSQ